MSDFITRKQAKKIMKTVCNIAICNGLDTKDARLNTIRSSLIHSAKKINENRSAFWRFILRVIG